MKYCTQCGHPVPEGNKFCTHCGKRVEPTMKPVGNVEMPKKPVGMKKNRMILFGLLGVVVIIGIFTAIAVMLWPKGEVEGDDISLVTEEELAKFAPDAYYPPNHGHSKAFKMQPRAGLTISAEAGAFERDVNMKVTDLTPAQRLQVYDKVMETGNGEMLFAWDFDAGLPSDSIIPGQYMVEMDLRELGVPENLWPYVECFRMDDHQNVRIMNSNLKDGVISFRACQNSAIGVVIVASFIVDQIKCFALATAAVAAFYAARDWDGAKAKWDEFVYFNVDPDKDVLTLTVKDSFGNFKVHFKYSDTENKENAEEYSKKLREINTKMTLLYTKVNRQCRKEYKNKYKCNPPTREDGEKWTNYLLDVDSKFIQQVSQDSLLKSGDLYIPRSIQELIRDLRLAERFCRSEDGLGLKPLSYTYDVYVADQSATQREPAVARPITGFGANIAINKGGLQNAFLDKYLKGDDEKHAGYRRMDEMRQYKMMVSVAHELSHIYEYEYCNVPQFFKNNRFLEAIGSVCEYWFVEWAYKKKYIKMSLKELLANDRNKKATDEIFASRAWMNMLTWPLDQSYPDKYFWGKADINGGYMLGEFIQYLYDHKRKSSFDDIMSNYSWGKSLSKSLRDGFDIKSEQEFTRLYEAFCYAEMDTIFKQQDGKTNDKVYLDVYTFDQYTNPVVRLKKGLGHEGTQKAYPHVIKTTCFSEKKDPASKLKTRYSLFAAPSISARDSTKAKFVFLEGTEHKPSVTSRYTRPWTVASNNDKIGAALIYKPGVKSLTIDENFYFDVVALYEISVPPTISGRNQKDDGLVIKADYTLSSDLVKQGYVTGMAFRVTNNKTKTKKVVEVPIDSFPVWEYEKTLQIKYDAMGINDIDDIDISIKSCWFYRSYDNKIYTSPYTKARTFKHKRKPVNKGKVLISGYYPITQPYEDGGNIHAVIYEDGRFFVEIPAYYKKEHFPNGKTVIRKVDTIKLEGKGDIPRIGTNDDGEKDQEIRVTVLEMKSNVFTYQYKCGDIQEDGEYQVDYRYKSKGIYGSGDYLQWYLHMSSDKVEVGCFPKVINAMRTEGTDKVDAHGPSYRYVGKKSGD